MCSLWTKAPQLYFIKDGKVVSCGTYDELFNESLEFKTKATTVES